MRAVLSRKHANEQVDDIRYWKERIEALLAHHIMFMVDDKTMVNFTMRNEQNNDQVQCVVCQSDSLRTLR